MSDKQYIHTGDSNNGLPVNAYVFLPLSELQLRLTGDPQSRKEAYIKDWLTFCAHRVSSIVTIINSGNYIPKPTIPNWKALKDTFDGSHLETRNNLGQPTKGAAKFLGDLLQPTPEVDTVKDIPLLIFRKWCREYYDSKICCVTITNNSASCRRSRGLDRQAFVVGQSTLLESADSLGCSAAELSAYSDIHLRYASRSLRERVAGDTGAG